MNNFKICIDRLISSKLVASASWSCNWSSIAAARCCWSTAARATALALGHQTRKHLWTSWLGTWIRFAAWCWSGTWCWCCTRCWCRCCTRCWSGIAASSRSCITAASLLASMQTCQESFSLRSRCTSGVTSWCWCWSTSGSSRCTARSLACVQTGQQTFSLCSRCTCTVASWCRGWGWGTARSGSTAAILVAAKNTSRSASGSSNRTSNDRQGNNQSTHFKSPKNKGYTTTSVTDSLTTNSIQSRAYRQLTRLSMSTHIPLRTRFHITALKRTQSAKFTE